LITLAHGIGSVTDLPVPEWLFLYGAGIVLVVSFAALALLWRRPLLEEHEAGRPLPPWLSRVLLSRAVRVLLGAIGFGLFALVLAAAFVGEASPTTNIAPTFVFVAFWLGVVPLVVLFGDVWSALNPWKALADATGWFSRRVLGVEPEALAYPAWLGCWPAFVGLFLFVVLELAYYDPGDPRVLARAITFYSLGAWLGALAYGSEAWFRHGDGFSVYFGLLARIAPFAVVEREGVRTVVVRPPFVGLATLRDPVPGTVAFVALMLGSVAFDGFSRTSVWQDLTVDLGRNEHMLASAGAIAAWVAALIVLYVGAVQAAKVLARTGQDLVGAFVASLVPIALVYAVSHYFTLLLVQGQFLIPLASDPFGHGWDLFGTVDYLPNLEPLSPNAVWYVQVATLVAGHVAGLALAHDRALAIFRDEPHRALRTQYPFLVLMVAYTVGGLWLLSLD
jgi:hypothetical protein